MSLAITITIICFLFLRSDTNPQKITVKNCLNLFAGNIKIELNYPEFLRPVWYLDPITSVKENSNITLRNKITDKDSSKIILIVDDIYMPCLSL